MPIKEVIKKMTEKVKLVFTGRIIEFELGLKWTSKTSNKDYVFNTVYVLSAEGGRVPVGMTDDQALQFQDTQDQYVGKDYKITVMAEFYHSQARLSLISITK